ncbi:MAG TPA: HAMP domain-containing sensor histidine kinase, partial [Pirellulales bacterium]|nr:HAMP domain-containing sensor histidine kinase [Pirellulales bacterium]
TNGAAEAVCWPSREPDQIDPHELGNKLVPWIADPACSSLTIPNPFDESEIRIAVMRFASGVVNGLMVAGSTRPDFPSAQERLLMSVAANQAAVAIHRRRIEDERIALVNRLSEARDRERTTRIEAEEAIRLRDEFLATLSHELRTPLNSVFGWAQILRLKPDDPEIRAEAIDAIERGARAQVTLINDLLDMSRIISGKLKLDMQTIEPAGVIEAAIEAVAPAAEANSIAIERRLDPTAGPIRGDPARLQQVFWNLLSNSVKFTPRGGRVTVELDRADSHCEVCVSDTGRGIAPDFLPLVFDRFRQADSSHTRRFGGLGLGLAIVKHLVEMHGGKVEASSPGEGQGATFKVELPLAAVPKPRDPASI